MKSNSNYGEEINLLFLVNTIKRRKNIIFAVTFILTSIFYFYLKKEDSIWIGEFKINTQLIKSPNQKKELSPDSGIGNLLSFTGGIKNKNATQLEILKSPLVLNTIYEFVKKEEIRKFNKVIKNYNSWLAISLDINYIPTTDILSVSYKHKDKDFIELVLNKIAKKYQEYSIELRDRELVKGISYLESQFKLTTQNSLKSSRDLNEFSIENGLGNIDGFVSLDSINNNNNNNNNEIKKLELNNSAGQRFANQFKALENLETKYVQLSANLKPNSKTLIDLKNKINTLRDSLKRPNEILLKYKDLTRIAIKNEMLLKNIEEQLDLLKLEKAKNEEPWQVISKPFIDNERIYPNIRIYLMVGMLVIFSLCSFIAIIFEKISNFIYEFEEINEKLPYPFIDTLYKEKPILNDEILYNGVISKIEKNEKIASIYISEKFFSSSSLEKNLFTSYKSTPTINLENINDLKNYKNIILIYKPGEIKSKSLEIFLKQIQRYSSFINGWFFLEN
tara:strand:- start:226 stop:1740 length:1515 start_codon:yes stop_codon:yes gene_type:complete